MRKNSLNAFQRHQLNKQLFKDKPRVQNNVPRAQLKQQPEIILIDSASKSMRMDRFSNSISYDFDTSLKKKVTFDDYVHSEYDGSIHHKKNEKVQYFQAQQFTPNSKKKLDISIFKSAPLKHQTSISFNKSQNEGSNQCKERRRGYSTSNRYSDYDQPIQQAEQSFKKAEQIQHKYRYSSEKKALQRGQKAAHEFLQECSNIVQVDLKKKRIDDPLSQQRLSTYNQLKQGLSYSNKPPLVEFNFLLKYLFKCNYNENELEDDNKVIPASFSNPEEYEQIFEYLFLNETYYSLKSSIEAFIKKPQNEYCKIQVKVDESFADRDGTVLQVRVQDERKKKHNDNKTTFKTNQKVKKSIKANDSYEDIPDGQCNTMLLKNHIVILARSLKLEPTQMNTFDNDKSFVLGWLLEPQKATFFAQLKVLTFSRPELFGNWTDAILMPLTKISTQIREYMMIKALRREQIAPILYDPSSMRKFISDADQTKSNPQSQNIIDNPQSLSKFLDSIRPLYNSSQFQCIKDISLIDKGLCLLQGPPGTGKTHTLLGLVSAIYHRMMQQKSLGLKKILICAPSNAAIDEILSRLIDQGLRGENNEVIRPKVIRIGAVTPDSHDQDRLKIHSLEEQAQRQLFEEEQYRAENCQKTTGHLKTELAQIQHQIDKMEKLLKKGQEVDIEDYNKLTETRTKIYSYLNQTKAIKRTQRESYQCIIDKLLEEAEIICTTLASAGSDKLERFRGLIDELIIDEAAQCTEPTNIIPLRLGIQKMILIGDPKQLPATTFSHSSKKTLYNRSLFERILANGFTPYFLSIQYRMQSDIRAFPSLFFYGDKLTDHPSIQQRTETKQIALLDCCYGTESKVENSYINIEESRMVIFMLKYLREFDPSASIGVICGYKQQVKDIRKTFKYQYPKLIDKSILSINTVDSFQGQEKDIIILSCVRSNYQGNIGFMSDQRRVNVAFTRARNCLYVIGNCVTLSVDECWREFIKDMIKRDKYYCIKDVSDSHEVINNLLTKQTVTEEKQLSEQLQICLDQNSKSKRSCKEYELQDFVNTQFERHLEEQKLEIIVDSYSTVNSILEISEQRMPDVLLSEKKTNNQKYKRTKFVNKDDLLKYIIS